MAFKRKKSKPFRQAPKELVQGDEFEKEIDSIDQEIIFNDII